MPGNYSKDVQIHIEDYSEMNFCSTCPRVSLRTCDEVGRKYQMRGSEFAGFCARRYAEPGEKYLWRKKNPNC